MKFQPIKCNWKNRIISVSILALVTAMTFPALADGLMVYKITDGEKTDSVSLFQPNVDAAIEQSVFDDGDYYISYLDEINEEYAYVFLREKFDVTVTGEGSKKSIHTGAETAENLVSSCGIELDADDETKPSRDTIITTPTDIKVIRVDKKTVKETEKVDYKTIYKKTDSLEKGQSKVKRQGKAGRAVKTYELVYRNGKLSEKNMIKRVETEKPTNKIVLEGTAQPTVSTSSGKLSYSRCLSVEATAYSGGGTTASGMAAAVGRIAVDPSVIPLGSRLYITSSDGSSWVYGTAVAADTGGAIKGNRIDLYFNSEGECESFGRRGAMVYVLD